MIREAVAEVDVVSSCVVFVRGSLEPHWAAIVPIWAELLRVSGLGRKVRYRRGAQAEWKHLASEGTDVSAMFDRVEVGTGCRWLELATGEGCEGVRLELVDLLPVRGEERASYVHMRFPRQGRVVDVVRLAEWTIKKFPLLWGSAGLSFAHINGPRLIAYNRIAVMAKRHWGVQIQDMSTLQWDALDGMPSVNWLTLIGNEFASAKGLDLDIITASASDLVRHGVFHRRGTYGLALAAGSKPLLGDINIGEDMRAYERVAKLVQPLLLKVHSPLAGPFVRPEVMAAWLRRFEEPRGWLRCNIAAE